MNRRSFFQYTAGTAAADALTSQISVRAFAAWASGRSPEEAARDEDFWTEIRNEFTTARSST
jgi:hypothetical protein